LVARSVAQNVAPDVLAQRSPFAAELTARRIAAGLTQAQLGVLIGRHWTTVNAYEVDRFSPSATTLKKIRRVLKWK
jgi:DNA-binding XRE family transcriptional regulator